MPEFTAVSSARGNVAGIVRAFEINLGLEAGGLGTRVAAALADATARGVASLVIVHELVALFQTLQELDAQLDRRGAEIIRAREIQGRLDALAWVIEEESNQARAYRVPIGAGAVITQQTI